MSGERECSTGQPMTHAAFNVSSYPSLNMKTIFIDCNDDLDKVFARVHRNDDPPITINSGSLQARDLPHLLEGYDVCLDDHSYMPTEIVARCGTLKHIVFLGTG